MATIITKRGNGVPTAASLSEGEQAIDLLTGRIYTLSGGVVIECGQDPHDIDFHTDVDTTTTAPNDDDVLTYDGAINTWVPMPPPTTSVSTSGIDTPIIYSPTGSGLLNVDIDTTTFISTPAYVDTSPGAFHNSSEWVVYSDASLTNPVYQSGKVYGNAKTQMSTVTGLSSNTDYWIVVRYFDIFNNVSDYSAPVKFTTGVTYFTIYEHGVSANPVINGNELTFDFGYKWEFLSNFYGGGGPSDPYTSGIGRTNNFGDTNPSVYTRRIWGTGSGYVRPANFGEHYWKFRASSLTNPLFPAAHVDYFDTTSANFNPAPGFRWTLWSFHTLARDTSKTQTYQPGQFRNVTVNSGSFNQSYFTNAGRADDIVANANVVVATSGYDTTFAAGGVGRWDWQTESAANTAGGSSPKANAAGQFWGYGFKKVELILP